MAGALGFSKEWSFTYWVLMVNDGCAASSAMSGSSCHGRAWLSRIARPNNRGSGRWRVGRPASRSEEHTSELQSLMRISYAVFCLKKNNNQQNTIQSI